VTTKFLPDPEKDRESERTIDSIMTSK
jgi:hypothetical protein